MAGFEDQLIAPAPYRETIPVDAYTKVGMIKQQQYDQGVEKVQGMIDSVAGIDALMPEQKDYLNKAVGQLQSQVSTLASSDFSNQQIVNSVGHLTGQIASDPIIQNTVYSTNAYRNESQKMKQAQDSGKSSPANEYVFQRDFQKWLGSGDPSKAFNATYTPYTDYKGKMLKALNEGILGKGHEDQWMTEMPYQRDGNGKVLLDKNGQPMFDYNTMIEKYQGVSADKIRNVLDSTLDDNDRNQMMIDGQYEYRGAGKPQLKQITDESYRNRLDQINSTINGLNVKKSTNQNNPQLLAQLDQEIAQQQKLGKNYQDSYLRDIDSIDKDPEGYKGGLYSQNWLSKFSEGYSYAQHSLSYADNPGFKNAQLEKENNLKFEEFQENKKLDYAKLGIELDKLEVEKYKADLKSKFGQAGSFSAGQQGLGGASTLLSIPNPDHVVTEAEFVGNVNKLKSDSEAAGIQLLASTRPDLVVKKIDNNGNLGYEWAGNNEQETEKNKTEGLATLDTYRNGTGGNAPNIQAWLNTDRDNNTKYKNGMQVIQDAEKMVDTNPNFNLGTKIKALKSFSFRGSDGSIQTMSGQDMVLFNKKINDIYTPPSNPSGGFTGGIATPEAGQPGGFNEDLASKVINTPAEREIYNILKKPMSQRTQGENLVISKLQDVNDQVNVPNEQVLKNRDGAISNILKTALPVNQPVATPLNQFKGPDQRQSEIFATNVYHAMLGVSGKAVGANADKIPTMLEEKNLKGTSYALVDKGDGNYSLRYINDTVLPGKEAEVDLTPEMVNNVFGSQLGADQFKTIRQNQDYSKLSNGPITTNVRRGGRETALTLNNGNINNYDVRYDVERGSTGQGQQIKLYIHDKANNKDITTYLNPGQLLSEGQTLAALQYMSEDDIKRAIQQSGQ